MNNTSIKKITKKLIKEENGNIITLFLFNGKNIKEIKKFKYDELLSEFDTIIEPKILPNKKELIKKLYKINTFFSLFQTIKCDFCSNTLISLQRLGNCEHNLCKNCFEDLIKKAKEKCPKCNKSIKNKVKEDKSNNELYDQLIQLYTREIYRIKNILFDELDKSYICSSINNIKINIDDLKEKKNEINELKGNYKEYYGQYKSLDDGDIRIIDDYSNLQIKEDILDNNNTKTNFQLNNYGITVQEKSITWIDLIKNLNESNNVNFFLKLVALSPKIEYCRIPQDIKEKINTLELIPIINENSKISFDDNYKIIEIDNFFVGNNNNEERDYFIVSSDMTIGTIKKYLCMKFKKKLKNFVFYEVSNKNHVRNYIYKI